MKSKECLICSDSFNGVPNLKCGHFICPECYVKLKQEGKCNCPYCFKKLIRKSI